MLTKLLEDSFLLLKTKDRQFSFQNQKSQRTHSQSAKHLLCTAFCCCYIQTQIESNFYCLVWITTTQPQRLSINRFYIAATHALGSKNLMVTHGLNPLVVIPLFMGTLSNQDGTATHCIVMFVAFFSEFRLQKIPCFRANLLRLQDLDVVSFNLKHGIQSLECCSSTLGLQPKIILV